MDRATPKAASNPAPAQPGKKRTAASAGPAAPKRPDRPRPDTEAKENPRALETAVQAAAELTEIGLQAGARALRRTLSRLPRP